MLRKFIESERLTWLDKGCTYSTYGGEFTSKATATVGFRLPEFTGSRVVRQEFQIDTTQRPADTHYDVILGNDVLFDLGVDIKFSTHTVKWEGEAIPLKAHGMLSDPDTVNILYNLYADSPILKESEHRQAKILDADYSKVDIDQMVDNLQEMSPEAKVKLKESLHKFEELFSGGLGRLNIDLISITLQPGAKPYAGRYYNIPKAYSETTRKEFARLVEIGVLRKLKHNKDSPWAAPSFVQAKKTGDVRVLTDLRKLNASIQRNPFPLPRVQETIMKLTDFESATVIDLSQGYYCIPLDEASQKLTTTVTEFGKYLYQVMPMGLASAPDVFQSIINNLLGDLDFCLSYLDDILFLRPLVTRARHTVSLSLPPFVHSPGGTT